MKNFKNTVVLVLLLSLIAVSLSLYYHLLNRRSEEVVKHTANYEKVKAFTALPSSIINGIKKFVFFIGYSRSGHSIIGSLMDAHPHVIIANELYLFKLLPKLNETLGRTVKENLYQTLYKKSVEDVSEVRAESWKGYTLKVDGLWQGRFDEYIQVIGDKSGGHVTHEYMSSEDSFKRKYSTLKASLSIPIQVIHVIRNPFDIISTRFTIHDHENFKQLKETFLNDAKDAKKIRRPVYLNTIIDAMFHEFDAVAEMIDSIFGKEGNILDVHSCDFVSDPKGTLSKIFDVLGVNVSAHYLNVCKEKVYKSVSRTRKMVEWSPEEIEMVEQRMRRYKFLDRYSFTSD